ncbi:MAG TPA: hypothetical protein VGI86_13265 [Acidimicrobiia bacterium]|jgi:hypothetical protein
MTKAEFIKKLEVAKALAAKEERERIRRVIASTLRGLKTSRDDDYGAGWNGALDFVMQRTQGGS